MSKAYLLVICLLSASLTGCLSEIGSGSDETRTYQVFEVWSGEGDFAPDPGEENGDAASQAVEDLQENPLGFQESAHNVSWKKHEHNFVIESEWEAKYVMLILTVDYSLGGGVDPSEGPAGTLDISIIDPNGGEHAEGYELVSWNNGINERIYLLGGGSVIINGTVVFMDALVIGTWTINISGSGLEGIGSIVYSGDYSIRVETEGLVTSKE